MCMHTSSSVYLKSWRRRKVWGRSARTLMRARVCRGHPREGRWRRRWRCGYRRSRTARGTPSTRYPRARRTRSWGPCRLSLASIPCVRVPSRPSQSSLLFHLLFVIGSDAYLIPGTSVAQSYGDVRAVSRGKGNMKVYVFVHMGPRALGRGH
ncbi:hypothetical protein B0H13DRAFT_886535 [Mycena leptocephala]|nr:hypothetical protein B0H13DRAFT_886535 [Mycena leptocephala]